MDMLYSLTIIGFLATSTMITFMWLVTGLTAVKCDMVRAVGSLYTHRPETALGPGLLMQYTAGTIMTYIYGIFLNLMPSNIGYVFSGMGLLFGAVHGVAVSLILASLLKDQHPIADYQHVSGRVAFVHVLGHMLFGLIIGSLFGTFLVY